MWSKLPGINLFSTSVCNWVKVTKQIDNKQNKGSGRGCHAKAAMCETNLKQKRQFGTNCWNRSIQAMKKGISTTSAS